MAYGNLNADVVQSSTSGPSTFNNTSGTEIGRLCRAWVNYNSTAQTITSSFNVSSVTYNATGDFTVNFTTAMPNSTYCVAGIYGDTAANNPRGLSLYTVTDSLTTTYCRVKNGGAATLYNVAANYVIFYGA